MLSFVVFVCLFVVVVLLFLFLSFWGWGGVHNVQSK